MTKTKKLNFEEFAWEVFRMRGAWRRLLAWHVPDDSGRCAGCHEDQGAGHPWPCTLHAVAVKAARFHEEWIALVRQETEPSGICHGCGGPAEGLVCGSCEQEEREAREKEESDD